MVLTTQQQQVLDRIKEFMESDASVFILCGYAGTGKTTMVKQIVEHISKFREVILMAPTGRAARVLQEKTNYHASTIHKAVYSSAILKLNEVQDVAESEFKLCFPINNTDGHCVAVVDEASMLSSIKKEQEMYVFGTDNLMDDLLEFIRPSYGGKVIFVGDPAQLPPINEPVSNALNAEFFERKGLKVIQAELTEVLRQKGNSVILKNAMQIRNLLNTEKRNQLVFEERKGQVEFLSSGEILGKYMEARQHPGPNECVVVCNSNKAALAYNRDIRAELYGKEQMNLQVGDILLVAHNNYFLDLMNGEFVPVLFVGETVQQSASIYVQEGGIKVRKIMTMEFIHIQVTNSQGQPKDCMLLLDFLNNGNSSLGIDEQRALFINFCMRYPHLKPRTKEFSEILMHDVYFNCLKAKYGYAVTGHKCQGGEWKDVFVDFKDRTGLSDNCLRWTYTVITRAREVLYLINFPHITPFGKFHIEPIQQCSKINEECRVIGKVDCSLYHDASAPKYLHAKWLCIENNMKGTPYAIEHVESKPYQEIYYIKTPDGIERYDIRYKKGGIFLKAKPQKVSVHNEMICLMLDDERAMPLVFDYVPSDEIHEKLYSFIRSACDRQAIQITNVVEHREDYSVIFYLRTSGSFSYIKIYVNESGFVTYAKPMSLLGKEDKELLVLIEVIQNYFEKP